MDMKLFQVQMSGFDTFYKPHRHHQHQTVSWLTHYWIWPVYQHQQLSQVLDMDEDEMDSTLISLEFVREVLTCCATISVICNYSMTVLKVRFVIPVCSIGQFCFVYVYFPLLNE